MGGCVWCMGVGGVWEEVGVGGVYVGRVGVGGVWVGVCV